MAYKTVSQVRDSLEGILTGININTVKNLNTAFERGAREMLSRITVPEASSHYALTLYDGVVDYIAPTDIFGSQLVDLRPQGMSRNITDEVSKRPIAIFDKTKAYVSNGAILTFEFVKGVGRVRISSTIPTPRIQLDPMNETTGWTLGGSASGLTQDSTVFWESPASLRFTLTGSSTGTLTKTITQADLTNYAGVGVVFLAFKTPSASSLTSFTVKLGSTSGLTTNFYSVSSTTGFLGSWVAGEYLLVALDLSTATTTGTPVNTQIKYAQISIAHTATLTNFYLGDFFISLPSPQTMIYQNSSLFQASGANPLAAITSAADSIILNDSALVIYEYLTARVIAEQQGGTLASGIIATITAKLDGSGRTLGLIEIYRGNNPSQSLRQISSYR